MGTGQTRLNGLAVSRAFGNFFPKSQNIGMISEPYVSPAYALSKRDTRIILASDGLWDIVPSGDRAFKLIKDIKDPAEAARKLCSTATNSRKCHDNVTVVVVSLRPEKKKGPDSKTTSSTAPDPKKSEKKQSTSSSSKKTTERTKEKS